MSTDVCEVLTLGESMVVLIPDAVGPLRHASRFTRALAGAESNTAIGLLRLGHTAAWISRLGEDEFGRFVLSTIRGEGVDVRGARLDPDAPTGVMFKERRSGMDSRAVYYRAGSAASRLDDADVSDEAFSGARWLHLTGITAALGEGGPRRAMRRALELARRHGLQVSFDPNYRARLWTPAQAGPVLREFAGCCDHLLLGLDEGRILFGADSPEAVAAAAVAAGAGRGAVKLGAAGALVWDGHALSAIAPHRVDVVETTGAGDAFAAGYIAAGLEGRPAADAGRMGSVCGALACTAAGDWEGAPEQGTVRTLLGWSGT